LNALLPLNGHKSYALGKAARQLAIWMPCVRGRSYNMEKIRVFSTVRSIFVPSQKQIDVIYQITRQR